MNHRKTTWYFVSLILLMLASFAWGADDHPWQGETEQSGDNYTRFLLRGWHR